MFTKRIHFALLMVSLAWMSSSFAAEFCGYQCAVTELPKVVDTLNLNEVSRHTPQICDANLATRNLDQDSDPVIGARKLMAMLYGSCSILKKPVLSDRSGLSASSVEFDLDEKVFLANREQILQSHPYLKERASSSCNDRVACQSKKSSELGVCEIAACMSLSHPPVYQFGSRLKDHSVFERVRMKETGALGVDDAAFISEALAAKGVRIRPDRTIDQVQNRTGGLSTSEFWALGETDAKGNPLDCFERAADLTGIKPGDLIVGKRSHISMVDTVGEDPFGIQVLLKKAFSDDLKAVLGKWLDEKGVERSQLISQYDLDQIKNADLKKVLAHQQLTPELRVKYFDLLSASACETLLRKPEDYRVTLIHSSSRREMAGVQREKVFPGLGEPGDLSSQAGVFRMKVLAACDRELRNAWANAPNGPSIPESKLARGMAKLDQGNRAARILRHVAGREGCRSVLGERPVIEASECVRCCNTDITYDQLVPGEKQVGETR